MSQQFLTLERLIDIAAQMQNEGADNEVSPIIQIFDPATETYRPVRLAQGAGEHCIYLETNGQQEMASVVPDNCGPCDLILTI